MIAPSTDPRWERLRKAVALEPVDKVPVCLEGVAWSARVTGMTLEEFLSDANKATQAEIDSFNLVGNADCVNNPTFASSTLSFMWMTGVKRPGFEIGRRRALAGRGVRAHDAGGLRHASSRWAGRRSRPQFLNERIRPGLLEEFVAFLQKGPSVIEQVTAADMPYLCFAVIIQPFESLCGGRTFTQFVLDLYRTPDKVEAGHAGHVAWASTTRPSPAAPRWARPACGSAAGARPAGCWPSRSGTASCGPTSRNWSPRWTPPGSSRSCTSTPTGRATCRGCSSCRPGSASSPWTA